MLEATKSRQAKEIRELKRRLRETRLTLPPKAYAALQAEDEVHEATQPTLSDEEDDDDEVEQQDDPVYDRIKVMIERMLSHGSEALKVIVEKTPGTGNTARDGAGVIKVLTSEEVEEYHGGSTSIGGGEGRDDDHWDEGVSQASETTDAEDQTSQSGVDDDEDDDDHPLFQVQTKPSPFFNLVSPLTPVAPLLTITADSPSRPHAFDVPI